MHLNRVSHAYVGSPRSRPIRRRSLECPLDYFSRSGNTKGPLPERDVEVTAIKIWFVDWRSASRGTAWPLEQAVELEEPKEAVRGEDLLIIRTLFNKLLPVIKRRKCSACSLRTMLRDRNRKIRTIRIAYNAKGPEFSIQPRISSVSKKLRWFL